MYSILDIKIALKKTYIYNIKRNLDSKPTFAKCNTEEILKKYISEHLFREWRQFSDRNFPMPTATFNWFDYSHDFRVVSKEI